MPTALELKREEWRSYHPSKGLNFHDKQADIKIRKCEALKLAKKAASLLRKDFGATKVVIFGSLASDEWFNPWSDIDLAAWGIIPESFYSAVALVTGLSSSFKIDHVDIRDCKPAILKAIEEEGMEI